MAGRQPLDQSVRRRLKFSTNSIALLTWLLAFLLAGIIISRLPLAGFLDAVASLQLQDWGIWIALNLGILTLLAGRWFILTRALQLDLGLLQILGIRQAGQLISFVTPGPQFGGEPLQVYWLWKKYAVSGPTAILAVGLDRFFELSVNFGVLLLAVLALLATATAPETEWLTISAVLLGLMLLMGLAGWLLLRQPARIRDLVGRFASSWQKHPRLQNLGDYWSQLNDQLQTLATDCRPALGLALLTSIAAWIGMIGEFGFLLYLADIPIELTSFILLFTVVRLAFLLPLPGGIGSVEAALFWAFQSMELPLAMAASLIVLMRLRDLLILLSGALVLPSLNSVRAHQ